MWGILNCSKFITFIMKEFETTFSFLKCAFLNNDFITNAPLVS